MRVLIAPDSFKESLSAYDAAAAMARGVHGWADTAGSNAEIDLCPLADGGEGTVDAICADSQTERRCTRVTGPLGERVDAPWAVLDDRSGDRIGVIETASCAGMMLVPSDQRDPTRTTTRGLGELLVEAAQHGCKRLLVGLGSSSTTDGGVGIAAALGWKFLDARGVEIEPTGGGLRGLARVERPERTAYERAVEVVALWDVDNPLLGEHGTARTFARQKGARDTQIEELERGLEILVRCLRDVGVECDPEFPGTGSAGGLGFGLRTFAGATLAPGGEMIMDLLRFDERVGRADLVLTGEGKLDATTLRGKVVHEVARRAKDAGVPAMAIVGATEGEIDHAQSMMDAAGAPLARIERILDRAHDAEDALTRVRDLLEACAAEAIRSFVNG